MRLAKGEKEGGMTEGENRHMREGGVCDSYGAFSHTAVLPAILRHRVDVNKVVMGTYSQEVTI